MSQYTRRLARVQVSLLGITTVVPALFVVLLIVLRWPEYWKWIVYEKTPMTSLQVVVMYSTALVAFAAGCRAWIREEIEYKDWWMLATAFLYFALDDRFAIHERVRDNFLAPFDVRIPFLPWVESGDFILLFYAIVGLALLPRFLRIFRDNRTSRRLLLGAAGVAFVAVLLDTVDLKLLTMARQRFEQTVEECLELTAQILFLQSFIVAWTQRLAESNSPGNDGRR